MAGCYQKGIQKVLDGTIDLDTSTLKLMLLKSTYTYDADHAAVSTLATTEADATNYTGGFAGAGRKTAAATIDVDNANNRARVKISADPTWSAIGGASNNTLTGCALIFETGGSDANSIPIAYFDFTSFTTNGSDLTLDFDQTAGNIWINC